MESQGPHTIGTECVCQVLDGVCALGVEQTDVGVRKVLTPHSTTTTKATMAWALQELRLHRQAERQGVSQGYRGLNKIPQMVGVHIELPCSLRLTLIPPPPPTAITTPPQQGLV